MAQARKSAKKPAKPSPRHPAASAASSQDPKQPFVVGLDVGSTTVKISVINPETAELLFSDYQRHHADIKGGILGLLEDALAWLTAEFGEEAASQAQVQPAITGSGGLTIAKALGVEFVQEVVAETEAILKLHPEADIIVELGGEDAKVTYLKPTPEQRMNGTCAGGTGAFIDQMSQLLKTDAAGLNELAANYEHLYPIASRCGVFAKTDLQPLINDGVRSEDLAASIFQAVATQTIAGLANGRRIQGNVVFLGGPLFFMPELREAFKRALGEQVENYITPNNAQLFVAIGAALLAVKNQAPTFRLSTLIHDLRHWSPAATDSGKLAPLFKDEDELEEFQNRHEDDDAIYNIRTLGLTNAKGALYLGIDAGSTTIKAALLDKDKNLLWQHYASNEGDPIGAAVQILKDVYAHLPKDAYIAGAASTGYGEALIKAALHLDDGVVETVAHYKAAAFVSPGVTSIIDIGGQDMKYIKIKNGVIDTIAVNEACSSGCGSFLQTFAKTLGYEVEQFANLALHSKAPVDLGSRCTVFMNSSVKQAQKEGASVADISAGLSFSVIKNALYKVIKLRDPEAQLGEHVVVQGGTFYNMAVLRAFETLIGREVVRPNISGIMGAFGAALYILEKGGETSSIMQLPDLEKFSAESSRGRCDLCPNKCELTILKFNDGSKFVTGNRCERGGDKDIKRNDLPNLFDFKYSRTFGAKHYLPLKLEDAPRGEIGIPRALNIYENYPFWFTLLTKLGFRVVLSGRSDHKLFEEGMDSIASENICYPAKLAHGHIVELLKKGVKKIFYPCVSYEQEMSAGAENVYNCPIVANYPGVIKNNMEQLAEYDAELLMPYFSLANLEFLPTRIAKEFGVSKRLAKAAVEAAIAEDVQFKQDVIDEGRRAIAEAEKRNIPVVVIAGRPYHIDPEIHHGIPQAVTQLGAAVVSEDAVAGLFDEAVAAGELEPLQRPLRVVDQWSYHSRLYKAAKFVAHHPNLHLVQLNSFGCGLDAVTTDQTAEILQGYGDIYTVLKIDEVSNLGAAKIRLRSLLAAISDRLVNHPTPPPSPGSTPPSPASTPPSSPASCRGPEEPSGSALTPTNQPSPESPERLLFTEEMRDNYKIICPQLSPLHFRIVQAVFEKMGFDFNVLAKASAEDIEAGLKYVNNDACYPAIIVIGQLINALLSGEYDPDSTAVVMSQTGGMCRATNYASMLRLGLKSAGFGQVPVLTISASNLEKHPGFKLGLKEGKEAITSLVLGDLLSLLLLRVRPYEAVPGSANKLYEHWNQMCRRFILGQSSRKYAEVIQAMVHDFDKLELIGGSDEERTRKPRVGIVGEILVKYHPDANNDVIGVIESEGCEAVLPGITDFFLFGTQTGHWNHEHFGTKLTSMLGKDATKLFINHYLKPVHRALKTANGKFVWTSPIEHTAELAEKVTSLGVQGGEGWLLAGEIIELIESGAPNVVCVQPFACLPNHVTGRGVFGKIRELYPHSNVASIDYDPGASRVNQLNRIKLMISTAHSNHQNSLQTN